MPIPIWALLGAGSALINGLATNSENKHEASEAKKANQMNAELAKWGWATRYGPKERVSAKKKSVLGSVASGAFGGAMLGNDISDWMAKTPSGSLLSEYSVPTDTIDNTYTPDIIRSYGQPDIRVPSGWMIG